MDDTLRMGADDLRMVDADNEIQTMRVAIGHYEMDLSEDMMADMADICSGDHMPRAIERVENIIIEMYRNGVTAEEVMAALGVLHDIKADYELLLRMTIRKRTPDSGRTDPDARPSSAT